MRARGALLVPICLLGHVHGADAAWIGDVEVGLAHADNVSLGEMERDIKSATALTTAVSAGASTLLGDSNTVFLTGDVLGTVHDRFSGLDSVSPGVTAAFRRKLGLGAAAPWVRASGSAARLEYRNDVRDGWRYRLGAGTGKRLGERWDLRAEYTFERRTADHETAVTPLLPGDVFEQESHTVAVRADFLYSAAVVLSAGYALRQGDVASTTMRNSAIFDASSAVTADDTFGPDRFAYKIDATTHILSLGLSLAVGGHASFNLGYEHQIGLGRGDIDYRNNVFRAGFLYSY
ncbi:MAG: hypothetical protein ACREMB_27040 [Candidatus Rokuibacteriota bacterium]